MPQPDDVYVISEEDILEPFRRNPAPRKGPRGLVSDGEGTSHEETTNPTRGSSGRRSGRAPFAATLSLFVAGAGQAYNGQFKLGLLLFLTEGFTVCFHWALFRMWSTVKELAYLFAVTEREIFFGVAVADFLLVFFLLYNIAQAYHQAEMDGHRFTGLNQPLLGAMASMVVPGWGQLLNAQLGKALFFLFFLLTGVYVVTLFALSPFFRFLAEVDVDRMLTLRATIAGIMVIFVASLIWVLSVYDAFLVARYRAR
jgi:TM2 domain-containing membrane protein YozV